MGDKKNHSKIYMFSYSRLHWDLNGIAFISECLHPGECIMFTQPIQSFFTMNITHQCLFVAVYSRQQIAKTLMSNGSQN